MRSNYLFTSESVSEGHPDKVADQISDAVVDLFIGRDPEARVACETLVTTNRIVLAGEVRCRENVTPTIADIEAAARETVKRIGYDQVKLRDYVKSVFVDVLPSGWMPNDDEAIFVNPTGLFEIGGPDGDAGLTGRKIIVDTYGGASPHGGGAFSGKDPTKVDRSAAYVTRYLAKNVVAAGLAQKCTLQVSYAIGVSQPLSFYVDLHGGGHVDPRRLELVLPE